MDRIERDELRRSITKYGNEGCRFDGERVDVGIKPTDESLRAGCLSAKKSCVEAPSRQ